MHKLIPFIIAAAFILSPGLVQAFNAPLNTDTHEIAKKDKSYKKYYKHKYKYPKYQYRYYRPYNRSYYYYNRPYYYNPYYDPYEYYYYDDRTPRRGFYFHIGI